MPVGEVIARACEAARNMDRPHGTDQDDLRSGMAGKKPTFEFHTF